MSGTDISQQRQAYGYAALAILFWSTVASAFKIALRFLDFVELLFFSSLASCAVLFAILLDRKQVRPLFSWTKKDYLYSAFLGMLNPLLYYLVLFRAYSLLPAQEAQPLNYTWPLVLVLLSLLILRQKISAGMIGAMLVSFSGVIVIATRGDVLSMRFTNLEGVILAVGSSVIWAFYWIFNIKDKREPVSRLFLNTFFGCAYVAVFYFIFCDAKLPPFEGLIGGAYVGLFEMGITFVVWLQALRLSRTTAVIGNLVYLSPFLSLIVIHFAVGETIFPSTIVGLFLIIAGIVIQKIAERRVVVDSS